MVHLTLAISDFMLLLISALLWTGAGFAGWGVLGMVTISCAIWWVRRRKH